MSGFSVISAARLALLIVMFGACHTPLAGIAPAREDIVLVVDNSTGMQAIDEHIALPTAISSFLDKLSRDLTLALILFDDNASLRVPFTPLGNDHPGDLVGGLELLDYKSQFSNSAAAIERAIHELNENGRHGAGKSIILCTQDRIDTGNEAQDLNFTRWLSDVLAEQAAESRIRIFAIAFGTTQAGMLQHLAQSTGGKSYLVTGSTDVATAFDQLAADIFPTLSFGSTVAPAPQTEEQSTTATASAGGKGTGEQSQQPHSRHEVPPESVASDNSARSASQTDRLSPVSSWPTMRRSYDWAMRHWVLLLALAVAVGLLVTTSVLRRQRD